MMQAAGTDRQNFDCLYFNSRDDISAPPKVVYPDSGCLAVKDLIKRLVFRRFSDFGIFLNLLE
jgi:hypothetical protein